VVNAVLHRSPFSCMVNTAKPDPVALTFC
jgi:hypothetical protein